MFDPAEFEQDRFGELRLAPRQGLQFGAFGLEPLPHLVQPFGRLARHGARVEAGVARFVRKPRVGGRKSSAHLPHQVESGGGARARFDPNHGDVAMKGCCETGLFGCAAQSLDSREHVRQKRALSRARRAEQADAERCFNLAMSDHLGQEGGIGSPAYMIGAGGAIGGEHARRGPARVLDRSQPASGLHDRPREFALL